MEKKQFEMFEDKLNVDMGVFPEVSFGNIGLKDQCGDYKGELLVFAYSYLASKLDSESIKNDDTKSLNMDIELDNFVKVFTASYLKNMGQPFQFYNFVATRRPLISLKEYAKMLKENEDFSQIEFLESLSNGRTNEDLYVRISICVCYPGDVPIPERIALDMGIEFVERFDMEDLDVEEIQKLYNKGVENKCVQNSSKIYYFYLKKLGDLMEMPFNGKGRVYKNNKKDEPPYIYETDTALFEFLDEYDKDSVFLSEMDVVVEDVSKLVHDINELSKECKNASECNEEELEEPSELSEEDMEHPYELSSEDYGYLYGKLNVKKIPDGISKKIEEGEDFTEDEKKLIKKLIREDKQQSKHKKDKCDKSKCKEVKNWLKRAFL